MSKLFSVLLVLAVLASFTFAVPVQRKISMPEGDLSAADSIGYGYYAAPIPAYYAGYGGYGGGYKYGGYSGYGGYRSYGSYYRPRIYSVWG
ncbi:shematrin-like protein 2 [Drosophila obscura]|uniref:shematrin-like protein 2 n=1 Tax=Drosophila obscura TaxID=7282 RepID=UPI001BB1AE4D|nr:shematrin-like protein 2 [Drosophila obscura]